MLERCRLMEMADYDDDDDEGGGSGSDNERVLSPLYKSNAIRATVCQMRKKWIEQALPR